jgi:hypothetical protein
MKNIYFLKRNFEWGAGKKWNMMEYDRGVDDILYEYCECAKL